MITYFIKAYKTNSNPTTRLQNSTMLTSPVNLILFFAKGAIITQENRPIEFAMPVKNVKLFMYLYHYVYIFFGYQIKNTPSRGLSYQSLQRINPTLLSEISSNNLERFHGRSRQ